MEIRNIFCLLLIKYFLDFEYSFYKQQKRKSWMPCPYSLLWVPHKYLDLLCLLYLLLVNLLPFWWGWNFVNLQLIAKFEILELFNSVNSWGEVNNSQIWDTPVYTKHTENLGKIRCNLLETFRWLFIHHPLQSLMVKQRIKQVMKSHWN